MQDVSDITIVHVANAIAAFIEVEWRSDDSPFDRYLKGDAAALSPEELRGAELFFGKAGCAACHSGALLTDQSYHGIAMPQIGPGRMPLIPTQFSDFGRLEASGDLADAYRFRTPSLRNVAVTAPYGHSGAYATLEGVLRHHLDPPAAFEAYDLAEAVLPKDEELEKADWRAMSDPRERAAIVRANELEPQDLSDDEVADLIAFLGALTDEAALYGRLGKPDVSPSGLKPD